jgi:iron(III) transport system substrate-binding protein
MRFGCARALALALIAPLLTAPLASAAEPGEVNIYSYRQPYLINPLLKEFSDETGIKVNVIYAEKGSSAHPGRRTQQPTDLLAVMSAISQATAAGIAEPVSMLDAEIASLSRRRQRVVRLTAAPAWSTPRRNA